MSHFIVLVIGPDPEAQLAPFHEYECTGRDDEYVTDVDITDEVIAEFAKPQKVVRLRDGRVFERYDDRFYTKTAPTVATLMAKIDTLNDSLNAEEDPAGAASIMRERVALEKKLATAKMFDRNQFELPDGAVELEMSADEARSHGVGYQTLAACADEYCGAKEKDGKFYRHTNVNAHWDWYQIGGRWTGWAKLKPGRAGEIGEPVLGAKVADAGRADQVFKGDIDFAGMRDEAGATAGASWDKVRSIIGSETWESWDSVRERMGDKIDDARNFYHGQPAIRALKAVEEFIWDIDDSLAGTREAYVQAARDRACAPYAFVRDSTWVAKGDMGWWGLSRDAVGQAKWNWQVNQMLDQLPDDTLITAVDCHI